MEFDTKPFTFIVVDTDIDFLVIKNPYCIKCFRHKMNTNILSKYLITTHEFKDFRSNDIRGIRIICECKKII